MLIKEVVVERQYVTKKIAFQNNGCRLKLSSKYFTVGYRYRSFCPVEIKTKKHITANER
jgi:hypothetical protein